MKNDNCWWEQSPENRLFRGFFCHPVYAWRENPCIRYILKRFRPYCPLAYLSDIDKLYERWHPCLFKMAAIPTKFHNISAYSGYTVRILMAISRFFGARNPVEQSFTHKTHMPAILLFKMAANPTNSWYRPISIQNVRRITWLGLYQVFSGEEYIGSVCDDLHSCW